MIAVPSILILILILSMILILMSGSSMRDVEEERADSGNELGVG